MGRKKWTLNRLGECIVAQLVSKTAAVHAAYALKRAQCRKTESLILGSSFKSNHQHLVQV